MIQSNVPKLHGLIGLGILAAFVVVPTGCGEDGFSGCEASRSCPPAGGAAGDTGQGGAAGSDGPDEPGGAGAGGMIDTGGSSGSGDTGGSSGSSGLGGASDDGGMGGMGGTPECTADADCDDDDPTNGSESCEAGSCEPGNSPPQVISVTPADGTVGVNVDVDVEIEFSEALDPDTVTNENIRVEVAGHEIAGALSYDETTVTFTPSERYFLMGQHSVTVSTAVTDADGAGLLEDFESSFDVRDGAWASPLPLSAAAYEPRITVDGDGNVLVGWSTGTDLYTRWYRRVGGWAAPELIMSCSNCDPPIVSANENGDAMAAWVKNTVVLAKQYRNGAWEPYEDVILYAGEASPRVAARMSPAGEAHVFIARTTATPGELQISRTDAAGVWNALPNVTTGAAITGNLDAIAFDAAGNGLLVWQTSQDTMFSRYSMTSRTWSNRAAVPPGSHSGTYRGAPAIALASDGTGVAAWMHGSDTSSFRMVASTVSPTSFAAPAPIGSPGDMNFQAPGVAFDGEGFVVAWTLALPSANHRVYSNRYAAGAWEGAEQRDEGLPATRYYWNPILAGDGNGNVTLVWRPETVNSNFDHTYFSRFARSSGSWTQPAPVFTELAEWNDAYPDIAFSANGLGALSFHYFNGQQAYDTGVHTTSLVFFE